MNITHTHKLRNASYVGSHGTFRIYTCACGETLVVTAEGVGKIDGGEVVDVDSFITAHGGR